VLDSLPVVEDEKGAKLRSRDEVVDRAIAVLAVAGKGLGAPEPVLQHYANEFGAEKKLTLAEKAFWTAAKPNAQQKTTFSWRYEALRVLLWSLGFERKLPRPEKLVDPVKLGHVVFDRGPKKLHEQAKLRPAKEILDLADLMYRYHWAVKDAELNGRQPPARLNADIVLEWDHAVRWLVGTMGQAWDDISLDT
jgi:hypothetical protein